MEMLWSVVVGVFVASGIYLMLESICLESYSADPTE